jgi:hypothetical protein
VGRKFIALSAAVALSIFGSNLICAQIPQGTSGKHNKGPGREGELNLGRGRFRELSPEDRQRFNRNADRWMRMSAEERKIMRDRENLRRERIKQEAGAALRDSGLRLDPEKRALFESRYMQERTKIEHLMREELEAKRHQQLPALIERLKKEFQPQQSNTAATATPSVSPKSRD